MVDQQVLELVADHLGCDANEVEFFTSFDKPLQIKNAWYSYVNDLSHMTRAAKQEYLQRRTIVFTPRKVGGVPVHLLNEVQPIRGSQWIKAAIVELADRCLVAKF